MEQLCFDSGLLTERYLAIVDAEAKKAKREQTRNPAQSHRNVENNLSALASTRPLVADSDETTAMRAPTGLPIAEPNIGLAANDSNSTV